MATGASNNTKLKNIYDMAGNMGEWTTEYGYHGKNDGNIGYAVYRGGTFTTPGNESPISRRTGDRKTSNDALPQVGFRVVLYVE